MNIRIALKIFTFGWALLASAACSSAPQSEPTTSANPLDVLSLIDNLRPSQQELIAKTVAMAGRTTQVKTHQHQKLTVAAAAPQVTLKQLLPVLIINTVASQVTPGTDLNTLPVGATLILPYTGVYSDPNTTLAFQLNMMFTWQGPANLFVEANPPILFSVNDPAVRGANLTGVVYNLVLDNLVGSYHDNGRLANAQVLAVSPHSGHVYSATADGNGNYTLSVTAPETYTVIASNMGFFPATTPVLAVSGTVVTGIDFDLMAIPSIINSTTIYGVIRDLSGTPAEGAFVEVVDSVSRSVVTDVNVIPANATGEFTLFNVPVTSTGTIGLTAHSFGLVAPLTDVVVDPLNPPTFVNRDVQLPDHAPVTLCKDSHNTFSSTASYIVNVGTDLVLEASVSDADGDAAGPIWSLTGAGTLTPNNGSPTASAYTYTAPANPATELSTSIVTVKAFDGALFSQPCTFTLAIH